MSKVSLIALFLLATAVSTGYSAANDGDGQAVSHKENNLFKSLKDFFQPQPSSNRAVREPAKDSQKKAKKGKNKTKKNKAKAGKKKGSRNARKGKNKKGNKKRKRKGGRKRKGNRKGGKGK